MLTRQQIESETATLDDVAETLLRTSFRACAEYRLNQANFADLDARLAAAAGTTAQILNAGLTLLESYGDGTINLQPSSAQPLDYSQERDREALLKYLLGVLYDAPVALPSSAAAVITVVDCA